MKEVIGKSFERCIKNGLNPSSITPKHLSKGEMEKVFMENEIFIKAFKEEIESLKSKIKNQFLVIITDVNGILLDYYPTNYFIGKNITMKFMEGLDFSEESCGTNAISIAMELKSGVEIKGKQHFFKEFKNWNCYAVPIYTNSILIGYLNIALLNKKINWELKVIIDIISNRISKVFYEKLKRKENVDGLLSNKQIEILKYISEGYIENKIASEMNLSQDTVKYHKKKIFNKLGANSSSEAITKSIRLGIIEI